MREGEHAYMHYHFDVDSEKDKMVNLRAKNLSRSIAV